MNENMVAFIICTNDDTYVDECVYYINRLEVPLGYTIDIITITGADGMTEGYNAAMKSSDAKYKVYLHQDVFILNRSFIADMIKVFKDKEIGMIGLLGCERYPRDARFSSSWNLGKTYACNGIKNFYLNYGEKGETAMEVAAVDGMLMATQYDVEWNDGLKGFHFYDASQSIEVAKRGLKIAIPYQGTPWILHDAGFCSMLEYDKYRKIFCELYPEQNFDYDMEDRSGHDKVPEGFADKKKEVFRLLADEKLDNAVLMAAELLMDYKEDTDLTLLLILTDIYKREIREEGRSNVFSSFDWEHIKRHYNKIKFLIRRVEYGCEISEWQELISMLMEGRLSFDYLNSVIAHNTFGEDIVWKRISGEVEKLQKE